MAAAPQTTLPAWLEGIREKYLAGEASTFVLHRNVFDTFLHDGRLLNLTDYLYEALFRDRKQTVCELSLDRGLLIRTGGQADAARVEPGQVVEALAVIEKYLRAIDASVALVVPYADLLLPAGEPAFASQPDRQTFMTFHRWSLDRDLAARDNIIVLIAESLGAINGNLLSNPRVAVVDVPMPDADTRRAILDHCAPRLGEDQRARFAARTAGLRSVQLAGIVSTGEGQGPSEDERYRAIRGLLDGTADAEARARSLAAVTAGKTLAEITHLIHPEAKAPPIDVDAQVISVIDARKREIIEKECAGLIEFVDASHGLDAVGGHDHIKTELLAIAAALRSGDRKRAPMGLLAVGPMGSGKTFVIKAFLKEAGLTGIALKNFRSKWVGSTESNLERVLTTVKAMGPIAVIIDEGDRSFGSASEDSDGGTSSRVIARLKEFMSDTDNRGRVLFVLMTNRPDKLDTDIKRPGRLDRKIPFFYAQSDDERGKVLRAVLKRYGIDTPLDDAAAGAIGAAMNGYSNADIEAVALLAADIAAARGEGGVTADDVTRAIADFIPPQERDMIEFMNLLAVAEASRRSLLPERFRTESVDSIHSLLVKARARALSAN